MNRSIGIFTVILAFSLAACANLTATRIDDRSITNDYEVDGFRWSDGGLLAMIFKVYEQNGMVSVCAAYSSDTNRSGGGQSFNGKALEGMAITIDGNVLIRNLKYVNRVPYDEDRIAGQSTCFLTDVPWKPEYGKSIKPELQKGPRNVVIYT